MPRSKNKVTVHDPVTPKSSAAFWIALDHSANLFDGDIKSDENDDLISGRKPRQKPSQHQLVIRELQTLRSRAQEAQVKLDMNISISDRAFAKLSIMERVLLSDFPAHTQEWLIGRVKEAEEMTDGGSRLKLIQYVEACLRLPLSVKIEDKSSNIKLTDLMQIRASMSDKMYGQEYLKDEILSMLARIVTAQNGSYIGFAGPPGIGKTMAARLLVAQSLEIPFHQISCGGMSDSSVLLGHSSTYVGAKPGQIAQFAIDSKDNQVVLVLDEIDKIASDAIWGVLTHLLDKTQNHKFVDHYFGNEVPIDISKWIFIVTYNDRSKVNDIVFDRLKVIEMSDYTMSDKKEITKYHLLPNAMSEFKLLHLLPQDCSNIIDYIVKRGTETHQTGVRGIKQVCETLAVRLLLSLEANGALAKHVIPQEISIQDVQALFEKEDTFRASSVRRNSALDSMYV